MRNFDNRKPLESGTVLQFPGMPCVIMEEIGRGSNAIVYRGIYTDMLHNDLKHTVLIKELFPLHSKGGIYRDLNTLQICHNGGSEEEQTFSIHKQSFIYGNKIHLKMLHLHPELTSENINTFELNGTLYTILGFSGGQALKDEIIALHEAKFAGLNFDLRRIVCWMLSLLDALDTFHSSGFLHLDIAPDNILLLRHGQTEHIILIDYNSAHPVNSTENSIYSIKSGYSAPEIKMRHLPTPASDIFSVTAVFYYCLTGTPLTPFQISRSSPPEIQLPDTPDTVYEMVKRILKCGLNILPKRRYQSISEMRMAMEELLDRIDKVGITHWALWESARQSAKKIIKENPAYNFIQNPETRFPIQEDSILPALTRESHLLIANGGMGKTTIMLYTAITGTEKYAPSKPAILYIPLQSWRTGDTHFITDRILENLRFKKLQNTYETARHTLFQLLQQEDPKNPNQKLLFLLLDGLNEVCNSSHNEQLLSEIQAYAVMPCVSVLVASRSLESGLSSWPVITLNPLPENCVKEILEKEQLLIPEEKEVIDILRIPFMLSLFLNSSKTEERQIFIHTQADLLETYLCSLALKFPDIPKARTEMAVYLILPAIAHEFQKRECPLSDKVLMGITNQAFHLLSSKFLMKAFPQWIGRSGEIKGEAATPDIWYGMIIHDLLWKRQGLLIRDGDAGYMVSHQILSSYLNTLYLPVQRKIWQRKRIQWTGLLSSVIAAVLITIYCLSPPLYNEIYARNVIDYAVVAYGTAGEQYSGLRHLTDCAISSDSQAFNKNLRLYRNSAVSQKISGFNATTVQAAVKQMLSTGKAMPGSKKPFDAEHYIELINFAEGRIEEYNELVETLVFVMDNENAYKNYSKIYFDLLSKLIDTDAKITACLYQIVCEPHIKKLYGNNSADADSLRIYIAAITEQNKFLSENMDLRILQRQLIILQGQRAEIIQEIHQCGVIAASKFAKEDSL